MAWKFTVGEVLTAGNLNAVTKPVNAVAHAKRAANQSIAHSTLTTVAFDTAVRDARGWIDTTTGVFTPDIAGWYRLNWWISWAAPGADVTFSRLLYQARRAGTNIGDADQRIVTVADTNQSLTGVSIPFQMNGTTDACELKVLHINSAATAEIIVANQCGATLELIEPT